MSKYFKWYSLVALILLIAIWFFSNYIANQQQTVFLYDFESTTAGGMNALKRFLIKQGFEVTKTDTTIPTDNSPLLILISGSINESYQPEALISWIKSGGVVIEFTEESPYLIDLLNDELNQQPVFKQIEFSGEKIIHSKHQWFQGLPYKINNKYLLGVTNPDTGFYKYKDTFIIFQQQYGSGTIITWSDPDGLSNKNLVQYPNNAVVFGTLIKQLKPDGGIIKIIDLRLTDFQVAKTQNPFQNPNDLKYWVILLAYIIGYLSLILWKLAARFGRPRPLVLAKGRTYDEFVYFLAGLFQQAKASQIVIDNLSAALLKTIIEITGHPPDTPVEDLIVHLETITNKNYSDLKNLFNNLKQPVPQKQFLNVALTLERYRKELSEWKRFN
ncbi:MAG TPA: hypothetical protein PL158_05305 [Bacillota bacterium]|nr:hypothetical protein [Bacillota bacterium]HOL09203.1 hypothetical protein [Bacillota bacterium]